MTIALGIDTGGTYTDAALVDNATGRVLCAAKALTTRRDLSIGIGEAVDAVFHQPGAPGPGDIDFAALSTTLATNAIVEGQGSPVCLVLIGYDPELIQQYGFEEELVTSDVVYIDGGHDIHGSEAVPLDELALRQAVLERDGQVEAYAVSGYFGVRNPAHDPHPGVSSFPQLFLQSRFAEHLSKSWLFLQSLIEAVGAINQGSLPVCENRTGDASGLVFNALIRHVNHIDK